MSHLRVFAESKAVSPIIDTGVQSEIGRHLKEINVRFEQWTCDQDVEAGADQETVITAYRADIDRIMEEGGFKTVDVISLSPDHPDKDEFRQKFLKEHTHTDDEVRFFVSGSGLFSLHVNEKVYEVLCAQGDLISVPDGTRHWFDMGPNPSFACIRIFTNAEGWVAHFTGSDIADRFNRLEN